MSDLRQAAQQALEALEAVYGDSCDAIHALRAALAQQAEPLVWEPTWRLHALTQREYDALHEDLRWNYRRIATPKAEPAQEPVGEMRLSEIIEGMVVPVVPAELPVGTKLYAAPQPQRPPLTDEEIRAHADKHLRYQPQSYEASGVFDLVRAIERAVRGE